jgi:nitrate reductase beta subunit
MKTYDSLRREVLYNMLIEFGVHMKLVRIVEMCLNGTCAKVCVSKHLSRMFSIQND